MQTKQKAINRLFNLKANQERSLNNEEDITRREVKNVKDK